MSKRPRIGSSDGNLESMEAMGMHRVKLEKMLEEGKGGGAGRMNDIFVELVMMKVVHHEHGALRSVFKPS